MSNPITTASLHFSNGYGTSYKVPDSISGLLSHLREQFPDQFPTVDKEAERLLATVCMQIESFGDRTKWWDDVPGIKEWWAKHKPKSEREKKKIEKIQSIFRENGVTSMKGNWINVAEEILKALEEE